MKYFFIRSFLYLAMASTVAHGALLSIDVNGGSSPTESGFIGQNSSGVTHSTIVGDITVSYAGQQGAFDRGDQGQPNPDLYRDFIFDNAGSITLTLSGPGISANTQYVMSFWFYDSGEGGGRNTSVAGTSGTTGPSLGPFDPGTAPTGLADPDNVGTGTFTSDGSGNLTFIFTSSNNRTVLNAFEIDTVPEPSTLTLLGLGALGLLLRRR